MIRNIAVTCILIAFGGSSVSAQFLIFWDTDEGDWNVSENWFEEFGPPDAELGDVGVVSNGGLAFLDEAATVSSGGVIIGERGSEEGTLHIRSGGELTVIDEDSVDGSVHVGQSGQGTLIVDRGGSLAAQSLRSAGDSLSSLVLGGGSSGQAEVNVNGPAVLGRHTRVIGPHVTFEAESLNLSGTLTSEITGAQHSTFDINGGARLGGILDLQFADGLEPNVGQTWDLIDAETISGSFAEITSNVSLGSGLSFIVNSVEGGDNGVLAQLGVDSRLQLTIDRRSGASQIQNLAEGQTVSINGYGVGSASGLINDGNWIEFAEGWSGNGSNTHVAELNLTGAREIGPSASIDLGNLYAFQAAELGQSNEDVFFEYHVEGGDVVEGLIDFTGAHNDVVLVVEEDGVFIQNQSTSDVTINGYAIVSPDGGLDPNNWTSLSDGGDAAWTESNPANNHITELNLSGTLTLPATSDPISLGQIVNAGANDLEFVVNFPESGPHTATVEYDDGVIEFGEGLLGDCDGDGALTAADLECISTIDERDAVLGSLNTLPGDLDGNGDVAFPDFLRLSTNFGQVVGYTGGNIDLVDTVSFADFLTLSTNFGNTPPAASVPEPTGMALIFCTLVLLTRRRSR